MSVLVNRPSPPARARRLLVVANETLVGDGVVQAIERHAHGAEVLVLAPALQGRLAYWTSADDRPRRLAEARLGRCLDALRAVGVHGEGLVGDADPLLAIEDALRLFPADEILIATHPEHRSNWLARHVVRRAGDRFWHPVHHVVIDTAVLEPAA